MDPKAIQKLFWRRVVLCRVWTRFCGICCSIHCLHLLQPGPVGSAAAFYAVHVTIELVACEKLARVSSDGNLKAWNMCLTFPVLVNWCHPVRFSLDMRLAVLLGFWFRYAGECSGRQSQMVEQLIVTLQHGLQISNRLTICKWKVLPRHTPQAQKPENL